MDNTLDKLKALFRSFDFDLAHNVNQGGQERLHKLEQAFSKLGEILLDDLHDCNLPKELPRAD